MFDLTVDYFNSIMRALPAIIMVSSIIETVQGYEKILFPLTLVGSEIISRILKYVSKGLLNDYGERPHGATNCGIFVSPLNCNKMAISYGMPSGHAQFMWTAATYQFLLNKPASSIYIGLALTVSISRYYLGCHSIDQIIVGMIAGIIVGYISIFMFT